MLGDGLMGYRESGTLMIILVEILTLKPVRSFGAHRLNVYEERNTFQHFIIWEFMEPVPVECQTIDKHDIQLSICYYEIYSSQMFWKARYKMRQ